MRTTLSALAVLLAAARGGAADDTVFDTGGHFADYAPAALTRDGKRVVTLGNGALRVWDAATGALARTLWLPAGACRPNWELRLWLSPDGATAAVPFHTHEEPRGKLALVPLDDRGTYRVLGGDPFNVAHVAFSADGTRVATSGGTTAHVWEVATGRAVCGLTFDADHRATGLAFAPDGKTLAVGLPLVNFHEFKKSVVALYDAATGKWQSQFAFARDGHPRPEWAPDGKLLAVHGTGGTVDVHEPNGTAKLALARAFLPGARRGAAGFDAAGRFLSVTHTDTGLSVWDELTGRPVWAIRDAAARDANVQFAAGGTRLIVRAGYALRVFDAAGRELSKFEIGAPGFGTLAWAKEGPVLAWGAGRSTRADPPPVGALDLAALRRPAEPPALAFRGWLDWDGAVLKHDDYSASVTANGKVVKLAYEFDYDCETIYSGRLAGPKHAVLATAQGLMGFDPATGARVTDYKPFGYVYSVAPSADGKLFAAAGGAHPVVSIFKPGAPDPVLYVVPHGKADWLAWTPGGAWFASDGGAKLAGRLHDRGPGKLPTFVPFDPKLKDADKVKAAVR